MKKFKLKIIMNNSNKKIPYAQTNFEKIRTNNYLYVDKTRFIEQLENSEGYTDIYLRRSHLHPGSISEWVWEIKYIKQKDAKKKNLIETAKKEAKEQLQRYKNSNLFKDRTDVRYLSVVFVGKKDCMIEEV